MAGAIVTTNILETAVSFALGTLRERIVLAKVCNRDYEEQLTGQSHMATVNVMVPAAVAVRSVTPDVVPPAVTALTPTSVAITLDQWNEAPFAIDDKGIQQLKDGIVPRQLEEAAKAMANDIDDYLWGLTHGADGFYSYAGVAGTTPFSSNLSEYLDGVALANNSLMGDDPRTMIIDTAANSKALGLRAIQDASYRSTEEGGLVRGSIGNILGAEWAYSQNVPSHTNTGTGTIIVNDASVSVGDTTLTWDGGGTAPAAGDIFTVAGDTQTYVVSSTTSTVITQYPAAKVAWADNAALTFKATHVVNLLIHRDAIALAIAPKRLTAMTAARRANIATAIDEESGLGLTLEVSDQHYQTQWSLSAFYGAKVVRRSHGVRIAG